MREKIRMSSYIAVSTVQTLDNIKRARRIMFVLYCIVGGYEVEDAQSVIFPCDRSSLLFGIEEVNKRVRKRAKSV